MFEDMPFDLVLDDLQTRFILNIPQEELGSIERICFQIEQAHWFYEDFCREENDRLPSMSLKKFSGLFFKHCPLLQEWSNNHEKAFADFMQYKVRVPVCGAVILNGACDKVLLVRGYKANATWSFPRGKINKNEKKSACAVREVMEEIGFDIYPYQREKDLVQRTIREQQIVLYIVKGIPEDTKFVTQTKKEIGDIKWFKLTDLPGWGGKKNVKLSHKFYMVTVFVSSIKKWIEKNGTKKLLVRNKKPTGSNLSAAESDGDVSGMYNSDTGGRSDFDYGNKNGQGRASEEQTQRASEALKDLLGISLGGQTNVQPGPPPMPPSFGGENSPPPPMSMPPQNFMPQPPFLFGSPPRPGPPPLPPQLHHYQQQQQQMYASGFAAPPPPPAAHALAFQQPFGSPQRSVLQSSNNPIDQNREPMNQIQNQQVNGDDDNSVRLKNILGVGSSTSNNTQQAENKNTASKQQKQNQVKILQRKSQQHNNNNTTTTTNPLLNFKFDIDAIMKVL